MSFDTSGNSGPQVGGASFGIGIDLQSFERDLDQAEAVARARVARIQSYFDTIRINSQAAPNVNQGNRSGGGPASGFGETTADLNRTIRRTEQVIQKRTYRLDEGAKPPAPAHPVAIRFAQQVTIQRVYHAENPSLPALPLPESVRQIQRVFVNRTLTVGELPALPQLSRPVGIDLTQDIRIQRIAHTVDIRRPEPPLAAPPRVAQIQVIEIDRVSRTVQKAVAAPVLPPPLQQDQRVLIRRFPVVATVGSLPAPAHDLTPAQQRQTVTIFRTPVLALQGAPRLPALATPTLQQTQHILVNRVASIVAQPTLPPVPPAPLLTLTQSVAIRRLPVLVPVQQALPAPRALPALTGNQELTIRRLAHVTGPAALAAPRAPQPVTQTQAITIQRVSLATSRPAPQPALPGPIHQHQDIVVTRQTLYVAVQQAALPAAQLPSRIRQTQVVEVNRQQQVREGNQLPPPALPVPIQQRQLVSVERQTIVTGRPLALPTPPPQVVQSQSIAIRRTAYLVGAQPVPPAPRPQQAIRQTQDVLVLRSARATGRLALPAPALPGAIQQQQEITLRRVERLVPPPALPAPIPPGQIRQTQNVIVDRIHKAVDHALPPPAQLSSAQLSQQITVLRRRRAVDTTLPPLLRLPGIDQSQIITVSRRLQLGAAPAIPALPAPPRPARQIQQITIQRPISVETQRPAPPAVPERIQQTQFIDVARIARATGLQPAEEPGQFPTLRRLQVIEVERQLRALPTPPVRAPLGLPAAQLTQRVDVSRTVELSGRLPSLPAPRGLAALSQRQSVTVTRDIRVVEPRTALVAPRPVPVPPQQRQIITVVRAHNVLSSPVPIPSLPAPVQQTQAISIRRVPRVIQAGNLPAPAALPPLQETQIVRINRINRLVTAAAQLALQGATQVPTIAQTQELAVRRVVRLVGAVPQVPAALRPPTVQQTQQLAVTRFSSIVLSRRAPDAPRVLATIRQSQQLLITRTPRAQTQTLPVLPAALRPVQQRQLISLDRILQLGTVPRAPTLTAPAPVHQSQQLDVRRIPVVNQLPIPPQQALSPVQTTQQITVVRIQRVGPVAPLPQLLAPPPVRQVEDIVIVRQPRAFDRPAVAPPLPLPVRQTQVILIDRPQRLITARAPLPAPLPLPALQQAQTVQVTRRAALSGRSQIVLPPARQQLALRQTQQLLVARTASLYGPRPVVPAPAPLPPIRLQQNVGIVRLSRIVQEATQLPPPPPPPRLIVTQIEQRRILQSGSPLQTGTPAPNTNRLQLGAPALRALQPQLPAPLSNQLPTTQFAADLARRNQTEIRRASSQLNTPAQVSRLLVRPTNQLRPGLIGIQAAQQRVVATAVTLPASTSSPALPPPTLRQTQTVLVSRVAITGPIPALPTPRDQPGLRQIQQVTVARVSRVVEPRAALPAPRSLPALPVQRQVISLVRTRAVTDQRIPALVVPAPVALRQIVAVQRVPIVRPIGVLPAPGAIPPTIVTQQVVINRVNRLGTTVRLALPGASAIPVVSETQEIAVRRVVRLTGATPRIPAVLPPPTVPQTQTLAITRVATVAQSRRAPDVQGALPAARQTQQVIVTRTSSVVSQPAASQEIESAIARTNLQPRHLQFVRSIQRGDRSQIEDTMLSEIRAGATRTGNTSVLQRLSQPQTLQAIRNRVSRVAGITDQRNNILIGPDQSWSLDEVIPHEVGHTIYSELPQSLRDRFARLRDTTRRVRSRQSELPPTQTAERNADEDFADSFRLHVQGGEGRDIHRDETARLGQQRADYMLAVERFLVRNQRAQAQRRRPSSQTPALESQAAVEPVAATPRLDFEDVSNQYLNLAEGPRRVRRQTSRQRRSEISEVQAQPEVVVTQQPALPGAVARPQLALPAPPPTLQQRYSTAQVRRQRLAQRAYEDDVAAGRPEVEAAQSRYAYLQNASQQDSTSRFKLAANRQLALPGPSGTSLQLPIEPQQASVLSPVASTPTSGTGGGKTSHESVARRQNRFGTQAAADNLYAQLAANGVHPDQAAQQVQDFFHVRPSVKEVENAGGGAVPGNLPPQPAATVVHTTEPQRPQYPPVPIYSRQFEEQPAPVTRQRPPVAQSGDINPDARQEAANTFYRQRVAQGVESAKAAAQARQFIGIAPDLPEAQQSRPARSAADERAFAAAQRASQREAESVARIEGSPYVRLSDRRLFAGIPETTEGRASARARVEQQRREAAEARADERAAARPQRPRTQAQVDRLISDAGLGEDTPARRGRGGSGGGRSGGSGGSGGADGGQAGGLFAGGGLFGTGISPTSLRVGAALFGGVGLGLNVVAGIARDLHQAVASAVADAAQINRSLNEIGVAYGQLGSKQIQAGAGIFAADPTTRGTTQQYLETATALQSLGNQYGLSTQQIQGLITASGQLARIHGTDLPTASAELQRVLGGDAEAAQNLGVNLTDEYGRLRSVGVSFSDLASVVGRARAEQILFADVQANVASQQSKSAESIDSTTAALDKIAKQADTARNALAQLVSKPFEVVVNVIANVVSGFNGGNQVQNEAVQQSTVRHPIGSAAPQLVPVPAAEPNVGNPAGGFLDAAANAGLIDKRFASQPKASASAQKAPASATDPVTAPLVPPTQSPGKEEPKTPGAAIAQRGQELAQNTIQFIDPKTGQKATPQQQTDFSKAFAPALKDAPPLIDQTADAQGKLKTATDQANGSINAQITALESLRIANQQLISQPGNITSIGNIQKQIGEHQTISGALQGPNFPLAPLAPEQVNALAVSQAAAESLQRQAVPFVASRQQNEVRARLQADVARGNPDRNQGAVEALNDLDRREGAARDLINAQHNQAVAQNAAQQAQLPVDRLQFESERRRLGAQQQLNDLSLAQIQIQDSLAPALLQEAAIRDRITLASQQNLDLTLRRLQAEQAAQPASNALANLNFAEEQATQRAVVSAVQRSKGETPTFDIQDQVQVIRDAELAKPQAQLANLEGQRGVDLASRTERADQLQKQIDVIPLQQQQQNLQPTILAGQAAQRAAQAQADALQRSLQASDLGSGPQRIEAETALLNARLQETNATGAVAAAQAGAAGIPPITVNLTVPGNIQVDAALLAQITDAAGAGAIAAITAARASGAKRVSTDVAGGR